MPHESWTDNARRQGLRPSAGLRINLPQVAADLILAAVLGRFAQVHPNILLELTIDDNFIDVVAEGFDASIRIGEYLQQEMVAVRLTPSLKLAIVGAPSYQRLYSLLNLSHSNYIARG